MRVGVVTTSYPRFPGDPAGWFVAAHVAWLRATGHDVEVIAAGDPDVRDPDSSGARITRIPAAPGLFYAGGAPDAVEAGGRIADAAGFSLRLAAAIATRRWDATIAHWLAPPGVLAAMSRGPLLAIAHGGDVHLLARAHLLPAALAVLAARRARLAFVSPALRQRALDAVPDALRARLARASIVQPMGVDREHLASLAAQRQPRRPDEPAMLAVLARLVPIKGVDVAIDALRLLRAPARLIVAGDGPLRDTLASRAAGLPVELVGTLPAAARDELLVRAHAVLVPSVPQDGRTEGMPLVALEALGAGVPLIASATGGLAGLPTHLCRLIPPGDAGALAAAIDATLAGPARPFAPASLTTVIPDWSLVGERLWAHLRHW